MDGSGGGPADDADSESGTDEPGAGIGRATDDLERLAAMHVRSAIDGKHLKLVGIGMALGGEDTGDHEGPEGRLVIDALDLQANHGEPFDDLVERGFGLRVVLEPGQ